MPATHCTGRRPGSSVEGGGVVQDGESSVGVQRRSELSVYYSVIESVKEILRFRKASPVSDHGGLAVMPAIEDFQLRSGTPQAELG